MSQEVKDKLYLEIKRRLSPQPVTIRADFSLTCAGYEGIDAIKEALRTGERKSTEQIKLKCNVIAAPNYKIFTVTHDKNLGIQVVKEALAAMEELIKAKQGKFEHNPDKQLLVMGEKDEKNFMDEIQQQIEENKEEDSEDSENNDEDMGTVEIGGNPLCSSLLLDLHPFPSRRRCHRSPGGAQETSGR